MLFLRSSRHFFFVAGLLMTLSVSACSPLSRTLSVASPQAQPMPDVQTLQTGDGLTAWLIEDHSVPIVSVNFLFRQGGSIANPDGREGLAALTAALLLEGAGDDDSVAFQAQLEEKAIRLSFDAGRDSFGGSLQTLKEEWPEAARLANLALTRPQFTNTALRRVKQQTETTIAYNQQTPSTVASQTWWQVAFPNHPLRHPIEGTLESLKTITRKDVQTFHRQRLAKDTLVVSIAGDVTKEEAADFLSRLFEGLPAKSTPLPAALQTLPKPTVRKEPVYVHRALPQATAVFGQMGIRRDDRDYFTAALLNHSLGGGGFSSRLMEEIREKRGLTYGIGTGLSFVGQSGGLLMGRLAADNTKMNQALDLTHTVWKDVATKGLTATELKDAQDYQNGSFPLQLDSSSKLASLLSAMQFYNLGQDYLDKRYGLVENVTEADVEKMAARLLKAEELLIVVVGDTTILKKKPAATQH
jgi:zinc protease